LGWLLQAGISAALAASLPSEKTFTNSLEMRFVRIEPGTFTMGNADPLPEAVLNTPELGGNRKIWLPVAGDADERPVHPVTISRPFYLGVCEVTNDQYECFDPRHVYLRGKNAFSVEGDEAVVHVGWDEAAAFCKWLAEKEGLPYRLPTEAEWEYACRAGTTTPFWTGLSLPDAFLKNPDESWYPDPERGRGWQSVVRLHVGKTPPNPWGLCDMHGNVEEWCRDWYGPYAAGPQVDPVGRADGDFKVTRGGSHGTVAFYLRSANRMGTLPEERSWYIGFRVALGEPPATAPLPTPTPASVQQNVLQKRPRNVLKGPDRKKPYFIGPREYVKIPANSEGPLFSKHNHDAAVAECLNGDLLAIWYTTVSERGRELGVAASRLPLGASEWQEASPFWDAPDRNDHAPALFYDDKQTLYHFNALSAAATWGPLAIVMRTSTDNGVTWSKARLIAPEHGRRHQVVESVIKTREGALLFPCDGSPGGSGGTALQISTDGGLTWNDPGGTIAGIHAAVAQLDDGRLFAMGRGDAIDGRAPISISADMGKTWTYSASPFPVILGGQRLNLIKLREGPLLLIAFANEAEEIAMDVPVLMADAVGNRHRLAGLFAAVSYDNGKTWPKIRSINDGQPAHPAFSTDHRPFTMSPVSGEHKGYMTIHQARNGVIHLLSSLNHYAFNLKWVETPPPAITP
jgi:formylglycine-generating enzyme required for sulfatase activity